MNSTTFDQIINSTTFKVSLGILIASLVLMADRGIKKGLKNTELGVHSQALVVKFFRLFGLVLVIGFFLHELDVSMAPLLASLGVGSIAVALAMQDTLANFFSGFYLLVDKPIHLGDTVKIADTEGVVTKMGWRSVHLFHNSDSTIIIPNSKVASNPIFNYDLPCREIVFSVLLHLEINQNIADIFHILDEVGDFICKDLAVGKPTYSISSLEGKLTISVSLRAKRPTEVGKLRTEYLSQVHQTFLLDDIKFWQARV